MIEFKDVGWWYWLVSAILVSLGVYGHQLTFILAIALSIIQVIHYFLRDKRISSFPVQVRIGFLLLLLAAFPKPLQFIYWIPTVGLWGQVLFGYCGMARFVSLLPWNRDEILSLSLLGKTYLSRPERGNIMQGFAAEK